MLFASHIILHLLLATLGHPDGRLGPSRKNVQKQMRECIVLGLGVPRLPLHDPDPATGLQIRFKLVPQIRIYLQICF